MGQTNTRFVGVDALLYVVSSPVRWNVAFFSAVPAVVVGRVFYNTIVFLFVAQRPLSFPFLSSPAGDTYVQLSTAISAPFYHECSLVATCSVPAARTPSVRTMSSLTRTTTAVAVCVFNDTRGGLL